MAQNKKRPKVQVRTGLKAGGIDINHGTRIRIQVRTGLKAGAGAAGGINLNHGTRIRVR